jgi:hypothetical protein
MEKPMNQLAIAIVLCVFLCMPALDLFAKTICYEQEASGYHLILSGGKPGQKPFSGKWVLFSGITVPTWGALIFDAEGKIHLSWCTPHDPTGFTGSFCGSATGTRELTGHFDNSQDGTFDGAITLKEVTCNSIPTTTPQKDPPPGAMGSPSKSEE